jgi:hypothetical protein
LRFYQPGHPAPVQLSDINSNGLVLDEARLASADEIVGHGKEIRMGDLVVLPELEAMVKVLQLSWP